MKRQCGICTVIKANRVGIEFAKCIYDRYSFELCNSIGITRCYCAKEKVQFFDFAVIPFSFCDVSNYCGKRNFSILPSLLNCRVVEKFLSYSRNYHENMIRTHFFCRIMYTNTSTVIYYCKHTQKRKKNEPQI